MKKEKRPKGEQATVYLEPEVRAVLKMAAAKKGSSASSLVEAALRAYLPTLGFQIASGEPTADATVPEGAIASPALVKIESTLADHAAALQAIQEQLALLKAAQAPAYLGMPEGEFTTVETIILEMVRAGRLKGTPAADIQRRLETMDVKFSTRRDALSSLRERKILRRTRKNWVLQEASGRRGGRSP